MHSSQSLMHPQKMIMSNSCNTSRMCRHHMTGSLREARDWEKPYVGSLQQWRTLAPELKMTDFVDIAED